MHILRLARGSRSGRRGAAWVAGAMVPASRLGSSSRHLLVGCSHRSRSPPGFSVTRSPGTAHDSEDQHALNASSDASLTRSPVRVQWVPRRSRTHDQIPSRRRSTAPAADDGSGSHSCTAVRFRPTRPVDCCAGEVGAVVGLARRLCCRSASWWRGRSATTSSRCAGPRRLIRRRRRGPGPVDGCRRRRARPRWRG